MIVVDTSAVIAILLEEPGYERIADKLRTADERVISPVNAVEVTMVLSRNFDTSASVAEGYFKRSGIIVQAADLEQAQWAQHAFLLYGKGRHPARLNLGDCFAYAAAKVLNAPLLFVGDDFAKTDLRAA